ncbi:MAG: flagellar export chaperone FliS, partial [Alphaproteobacteria bacterium]
MSRAAAEAYKTQAIMTAPPAKLVAMCYQRTIGALNDAIRAIEAGNIQVRFDNATRAANIIAHLWSTLD